MPPFRLCTFRDLTPEPVTTAAAKEEYEGETAGTKERRLAGVYRSITYKAFATVETEPGVFTSVISWTFTTPRIGVKSGENYVDEAAPAL